MSENQLTVALVAASDQCWETIRLGRQYIAAMAETGEAATPEDKQLLKEVLRFICIESLARELEAETV